MGNLDPDLNSDSFRSLPDGGSPDLCLDHPTPAEQTEIWKHYASVWGKALPLPQYLEECNFMLNVPLVRNGGMTSWVLVDRNAPPDQRAILSCCRTIRKRAMRSKSDGCVQDGIVHGVANVLCYPRCRGHGYTRRMMSELATKLKNWQISNAELCLGSVLYSDIGTTFYSSVGWNPASNNIHLEFPAMTHPKQPGLVALHSSSLGELCKVDEIIMRDEMATRSDTTRMAILADHEHMLWHHAKEEFVFQKIFGRKPEVKGVVAGETGKRAWAIWSHRMYCPASSDAASGNTLYILRLVIENGRNATSSEDQMAIKANLEAIIQAAQTEAAIWKLNKVKIWNPLPLVEKLIEWTGIRCERVERTEACVASLLWYGGTDAETNIEWVANEKYAYC